MDRGLLYRSESLRSLESSASALAGRRPAPSIAATDKEGAREDYGAAGGPADGLYPPYTAGTAGGGSTAGSGAIRGAGSAAGSPLAPRASLRARRRTDDASHSAATLGSMSLQALKSVVSAEESERLLFGGAGGSTIAPTAALTEKKTVATAASVADRSAAFYDDEHVAAAERAAGRRHRSSRAASDLKRRRRNEHRSAASGSAASAVAPMAGLAASRHTFNFLHSPVSRAGRHRRRQRLRGQTSAPAALRHSETMGTLRSAGGASSPLSQVDAAAVAARRSAMLPERRLRRAGRRIADSILTDALTGSRSSETGDGRSRHAAGRKQSSPTSAVPSSHLATAAAASSPLSRHSAARHGDSRRRGSSTSSLASLDSLPSERDRVPIVRRRAHSPPVLRSELRSRQRRRAREAEATAARTAAAKASAEAEAAAALAAARRKPRKVKSSLRSGAVVGLHGFLSDKDIGELMKETQYSRRELYALFSRFKALCSLAPTPSGIDKETLRKGIPLLSVEDDLFVDRVFAILDEDGSASIEWEEFVEAMSALEKGTAQKKAEFLFRVYDVDGDGGISKDELHRFFLSSLMVSVDENIEAVSQYFVDKVFEDIDVDDDGKLTVDEAIRYIAEHPEVRDVYAMFGRSMTAAPADAEEVSFLESRIGLEGSLLAAEV